MTTTVEEAPTQTKTTHRPAGSWLERMAQSKREIVIGSGIGVGLIIAGLTWSHFADLKEREANAALYQARMLLTSEFQAFDPSVKPQAPAPAKKGNGKDAATEQQAQEPVDSAQPVSLTELENDKRFKEIDVAATFEKGVPALAGVYEDYSSTKAGFDAAFELANLYFEHSQTVVAIDWFTKARESASSRIDQSAALYGLAYAHEKNEDWDRATTYFADGSKSAVASFRPEFLMGHARLLLKGDESKIPEAKKVYEKVIKDYAGSVWEKQAKSFLSGF